MSNPTPPPTQRRARWGESITASSPLSDRMKECLLALLALHGGESVYRYAARGSQYPATPNEIAMQAGYSDGGVRHGSGAAVQGGWSGLMAPANRVNFSLLSLEKRGLIRWVGRRDHRSGRAIEFTAVGFKRATELQDGE